MHGLSHGRRPPARYDLAIEVTRTPSQNKEVAFLVALRAASWGADPEGAQVAAAGVASIPLHRPRLVRRSPYRRGGLPWPRSRAVRPDAPRRLPYRAVWHARDGAPSTAATCTVDAAVLLRGEPEIRAWAAEDRPLLEELRARPFLERLDAALASAPETAVAAEASTAKAPTA